MWKISLKCEQSLLRLQNLTSDVLQTYTSSKGLGNNTWAQNPISIGSFIRQLGIKTLARRQRGREEESIFQYHPVCSTSPQRYPTSLQQAMAKTIDSHVRSIRGGAADGLLKGYTYRAQEMRCTNNMSSDSEKNLCKL